jgi:hypothetical protein
MAVVDSRGNPVKDRNGNPVRSGSTDKDQLTTSSNGASLTSSPYHNGQEFKANIGSVTGARKIQASVLKFPLNRQDAYPATMIFEPYTVDAYKIDAQFAANIFDVPLINRFLGKGDVQPSTGVPDFVRGVDYSSFTGSTDEDDDQEQEQIKAINQQKINDTQAVMGSKLTDLRAFRDDKSPAIALFLPAQLVYNDNVSYNDTALGAGGMTALAGINAGKTMVGSIAEGISEGLESIFNLLKGSLSNQAAQVAAARAVQNMPGDKLQSAASIGLQTGLNPGTRILFDKPNLRQFSFQFKLIPTSQAEAQAIEKIIKEFRYQMYPEEIDIRNIPIGYKFPNTYRISFKFAGGSIKVPKIQFCYLRDVGVTYNGQTNGTFFYDGHPTEVDLTLSFTEYRALSKRDIEAGF